MKAVVRAMRIPKLYCVLGVDTTVMPTPSQIVNTFQSSVCCNGDSSKLVDNKGLDGKYIDSVSGWVIDKSKMVCR